MNRKARHVIAVAIAILCVAVAGPTAARAAEEEARLIATLENQALEGHAAWAEKDKACRRLQVIGTRDCIPALAALLRDEKLSHVARFALEPMPYPEAGRALREALGRTGGEALVGVITSLGFRRDEQAVRQLARLLGRPDAKIAGAAAAALGRAGTPEAARALSRFRARAAGPLLSVAAEASLTAAEGLLSRDRPDDAGKIYEELLRPKWPAHARLGAFAGLLKARPREAVARVVEAVSGKDPALRAVAIANINALTAPEAAERFAAELPRLAAEVQAMLIGALAERGDAAVRPAIVAAASSASPEVRTAAAKALGKIGDASSVTVLCRLVADGKGDAEKEAAAKSLRALRGDGVDAALVECMTAAPQSARPELMEALVARDAKGASPALFEQASTGDRRTRAAAFKALGWLGGADDLPRLLRLLVGLEGNAGRKDAELAAVRLSRKIADEASRTDAALRAFRSARTAPAKHSLLRVLAGIGDARALEVVRRAIRDRDAGVRDAAVRALSDWADPRAMDALLDVLRTTKSEIHRVLVLRGCVRLLALGGRPAEDTVSVYRELVRLGRRTDEKKLLLAGLAKVADPSARAVVEPLLADAAVKAEAEAALLGIARGIMGSAPNEARSIAEKLRAESGTDAVRREAEAVLRQVEKFGDYIVAWQVTGIYGEGKGLGELLNLAFPPERTIADEKAKDVAWYMLPIATEGNTPWMLDLLGALGGEQRVAYVRTWVNSPRGQQALMDFGVDDGSKVWLNGKLVHADGRGGAATPGEHKVKVDLRAGWNPLVMKVTQDTGPWQFCLRIRAPDGGQLDGLRADATRETARAGPIKAAGQATASAEDAAPVRAAPKGDWVSVFNGRDLTGWKVTGDAIFKVVDGQLVCTQTTGKGGDLWTEARWDDFELRATYRVEWPNNSGIWFRHDGRRGYQFDILKYANPVAFSGTLYCPGKMFITRNLEESRENRDGWNEARIRAAADEITLWLNGEEVGKCRDKTLSKGMVGIQVHPGDGFKGRKIVFKNIDIRALSVLGEGDAGPAPGAVPSPVEFVMHRVGRYRSEACGVGDFNNDGRLDIVAGPFWYEAPDWKPHKYRDLAGNVDDNGKGYRHDFMNAPLDVDGDGLLDLVTTGWFIKQVAWYRNTGARGGPWPKTVAERNGNYETGDLVDVDGDGKALEIIPAAKHTSWSEAAVDRDGVRRLVRHEVSSKPYEYGNGVGDVNGDGRPDLLRPNAWYEAPADIRNGTWKEHPLAVGSLTPGKAEHTPQILVYDVDADGRNDIVTSSAHRHGIFWYRQVRERGQMAWRQNVIDKSWSQAHSLALSDIDGDGDLDLVTGKRFMAHNGGDPDPNGTLGVYWYELQRDGGVAWIKHVVSYGEGIGSGLNVPVVDMDGDGDLDIVVTGKWGGPVWFENRLKTPAN